jgi:hypothetical protein
VATTVDETERQAEVVDLMLTAYSRLRDRYLRLGLLLSAILLLVSAILCGFTFATDQDLKSLPWLGSRGLGWLRVIGVIGFASAVLEVKLDFSGLGRRYGDAAERVATLKATFSQALRAAPLSEPARDELSQAYWATMGGIPRIPERSFPAMKAAHVRKVELCRRLDSSPLRPVWLVRVDILLDGLAQRSRGKKPIRREIDGSGSQD